MSPTILSIDSANQFSSCALLYNDEQFSESCTEPRAHARELLPMIDRLLQSANCSLQQVDAIAFTNGPGSFTGLRIAMSFVQGLALSHNIQVITVSTLQCLAQQAFIESNHSNVLATLDARMQELYWGHYSLDTATQIMLPADDGDHLSSPEMLCHYIRQCTQHQPIAIAGSGRDVLAEFATPYKGEGSSEPTASAILPIAAVKLAQGEAMPIEQVSLQYLRNDVADKPKSS